VVPPEGSKGATTGPLAVSPTVPIFVDGEKRWALSIVGPIALISHGIRLKRSPRPLAGSHGRSAMAISSSRIRRPLCPSRTDESSPYWISPGSDDGWKNEERKVVRGTPMRHLFGTGKPAGITTTLKESAGAYLLEVVTGIRSGVTFTVQWTTTTALKFEDAATARRSLTAVLR